MDARRAKSQEVWRIVWAWAGRVPLRQKIVGIVVMPLLLLGFTIAWWVSYELGGWLSYLLSEQRVEQAMSVGMRGVSIITVLASVAGLGIGWFLTWVLTRPILEMTRVMRFIEKGDLSVRAPVWARDEIGELGSAFNAMIANLEASRRELERSNQQLIHRNRELAILYNLADMANQPYSHLEVSAHGLHHVVETMSAEAGMIVLLRDGAVTCAARSGLLDGAETAILQSLSREALGSLPFPGITIQQSPSSAPDQRPETEESPLGAAIRPLGFQTGLLLPIAAQTHRIGALILLSRGSLAYTDQHRHLIQRICSQLGVTLQNSQLWEELRQKEQLRSQLLSKVVSAQEEERQRISRELHDETGQALTSLLIRLKLLEHCETMDDTRVAVEDIRKLATQTLQEVRRLAAHLRPAALDDLGLISALEGYIYEYAGKSDIHVEFQAERFGEMRLPRDVEILLYRVIQESLTNIARHAAAQNVTIAMQRVSNTLRAYVVDDGCGFNVLSALNSENRGLGLLGMQERVELMGGNFRIESSPGKGTRIEVELTVPEAWWTAS